ncbi:MAG: rhodanese-like domain-containing protein [Planctomycetes bacterium]|nr:rhodanese-like domain-containing protein [Planctomycetota bacterium]
MKAFILAILCVLSASAFAGEAAGVPDISQADLTKAIADKQVVVIDVNGSDSYKQGHIPTALNYEAIKADLASKLPADKKALVVAYCGGPKCEAYKAAASAAVALGYTNVKHFSAGISGWKTSGAAVEKADAVPAPAKQN